MTFLVPSSFVELHAAGRFEVLVGHNLMSTRYTLSCLGRAALRLYDQSIAFYERLVADGHDRFEEALAETRANRAAAVEELG